MVVSKKWREIDTNRKYHMAYLFVPFPVALDDVEVIRLMQDLSNAIPRTFVQHLAWF